MSSDESEFPALIPGLTSGTSAVSSAMIIYIIFRSKSQLTTIYHRIMFGMSIGDILSSVAMAFTTLPMPKDLHFDEDPLFFGTRLGNTQTCEVQGFSFVFGYLVMFGYNGSLFLYNTCAIAFGMKEEKIVRRVEFIFHLQPLIFALIIALPPLTKGLYNPTVVDPWCAIASRDDNFVNIDIMRTVTTFLFMANIFACCILIIRKVIKLDLELRDPNLDLNAPTLEKLTKLLKNTKVIGLQAFAYVLSFMITTIPILIRSTTEEPLWVIYLSATLLPLQGFFNFLIFFSHKVYNYRRVNSGFSRIQVAKMILLNRMEEPLLFSRISMIQRDIDGMPIDVEIEHENGTEFLDLQKKSGNEVFIDTESKRDENFDDFRILDLNPIEEESKDCKDSRGDLGGFPLSLPPLLLPLKLVDGINIDE